MTKKEFDERVWYEIYHEMRFLWGDSMFEDGKGWHCTDTFIEHGKRFKKRLLQYIYEHRGFSQLHNLSY